MMKFNLNLIFSSSAAVMVAGIFLLTSCSSLTDEQKAYTGEWLFAYTDDVNTPFWSSEDIQPFTLAENGEWTGGEKNSGEWGGETGEMETEQLRSYYKELGQDLVCDLNFTKWKATTNGSIDNIDAHVIRIEDIPVLDVVLAFSYRSWGTVDDPIEGVTVIPNQKYSSARHFYFVKDSRSRDRLLELHKEQKMIDAFKNITSQLRKDIYGNDAPGDDPSTWMGDVNNVIFEGTHLNKLLRPEIGGEYYQEEYKQRKKYLISTLEYGRRKGMTNSKHEELYDLLTR